MPYINTVSTPTSTVLSCGDSLISRTSSLSSVAHSSELKGISLSPSGIISTHMGIPFGELHTSLHEEEQELRYMHREIFLTDADFQNIPVPPPSPSPLIVPVHATSMKSTFPSFNSFLHRRSKHTRKDHGDDDSATFIPPPVNAHYVKSSVRSASPPPSSPARPRKLTKRRH
ncbi:hypothetical protein C8F01DRAFT_1147462 [Mycena amicta]|nr:hypothetical protein C8F01DRAFT_1147462 [Mycena amicta]